MEPAKECVTTHLPNQLALKMDGAQAYYLYSTFCPIENTKKVRRVGGREVNFEVYECKLG